MYHVVIVDENIMTEEARRQLTEKTNGSLALEPAGDEEIRIVFQVMKSAAAMRKIQAEPVEMENGFLARQALHYIKENYEKKLTLTKVAEQLYVSPYHLSKILNTNIGKSFTDILNETRICEAKKLLKNPAFRVYDISEMVGFSDVAHFSRVFKKSEGISANEYRNREGYQYSVEYVWKLKKVLDF